MRGEAEAEAGAEAEAESLYLNSYANNLRSPYLTSPTFGNNGYYNQYNAYNQYPNYAAHGLTGPAHQQVLANAGSNLYPENRLPQFGSPYRFNLPQFANNHRFQYPIPYANQLIGGNRFNQLSGPNSSPIVPTLNNRSGQLRRGALPQVPVGNGLNQFDQLNQFDYQPTPQFKVYPAVPDLEVTEIVDGFLPGGEPNLPRSGNPARRPKF